MVRPRLGAYAKRRTEEGGTRARRQALQRHNLPNRSGRPGRGLAAAGRRSSGSYADIGITRIMPTCRIMPRRMRQVSRITRHSDAAARHNHSDFKERKQRVVRTVSPGIGRRERRRVREPFPSDADRHGCRPAWFRRTHARAKARSPIDQHHGATAPSPCCAGERAGSPAFRSARDTISMPTGMPLYEVFESITAEFGPTDGREERIVIRAARSLSQTSSTLRFPGVTACSAACAPCLRIGHGRPFRSRCRRGAG